MGTANGYRRCLANSKQRKDQSMTTASGHTSAILASKVQGTNIYNQAGDKMKDMWHTVTD